ncbi:protochlorophyllide reductase, chloroplastic isoform X2 [Coturnix japonica]|uniref:protochlorophyllide reductase, chloroplastic isoform X2 n=1 Tax=Coturnix japonica TaxID=93934 RepID=UPI0013A5D7F8|nr:protochlorophyllide reductase, chloroplastic isoform X2 [Coturnix japonica]
MLPGLCVPRSRCPAVHCQPGSAPIRAAARSRFTAPRPDSAPAGLTTLRGCRGWGSRPWTQRGSVCRAFPAPCPRCSPRSAGAQGGCACPGLHPTPVGSCPLSAPTHGRTGPVLPCGLLCCAVPTSCQRCPFRRPTAAPSRPLCAPFLPGADAPLPRSAVLFGAELPAVPVCGSRSHLPRPGAAPPGGRGPHGSHGLRAASRCVTGIGKCVAMELARRNARTILACRSRERGQAALEEIRAATGNPNVVLRLLDSSSMASVRAFAGQVLREEKRLDVLVNNAAVTGLPFGITAEGLERTFATNYLGPFLLTNLLLARAARTAGTSPGRSDPGASTAPTTAPSS